MCSITSSASTTTSSAAQTAGYSTGAEEEFQVNTAYGISDQYNPSITGLADGGYVVTWESRYQDGSDYGVYSQRYDADGSGRLTCDDRGAGIK